MADDMDRWSPLVLERIRKLPYSLSEKTTLAMVIAAVFSKASSSQQSVLTVAQTLALRPNHLQDVTEGACLIANQRLSVGGETLENEDIQTLSDGQFINDKVFFFIPPFIHMY